MRLFVLGASVAVKWFVPGEAGRAEAIDLLERVHHTRDAFAVPELFFNEMLAVLARLAGNDAAAVGSYMEALQNLGFERIGNGRELLGCAADLACAYRLTGYDMPRAPSSREAAGSPPTRRPTGASGGSRSPRSSVRAESACR